MGGDNGICEERIFAEVFQKHSASVQRFVRSKGLSIAEAADVAQDAFSKLWANCSKVTAEKALSFLFTASRNLVIDNVRKSKVRATYLSSLPINQQDIKGGDYQLEMEEYRQKLEGVIASMKDGDREVFLLSRIEGMKYKEIADAIDLSVKAVEKRMSNALKHLINQGIVRKI